MSVPLEKLQRIAKSRFAATVASLDEVQAMAKELVPVRQQLSRLASEIRKLRELDARMTARMSAIDYARDGGREECQ